MAAGLAAGLALAGQAVAQVGFSANLQSEYRYRGRPTSEGGAVGGLNIAYDHASGLYAGGSLMAVDTVGGGIEPFGYWANLGYGRRAGPRVAWDVGVSNSEINYYRFARRTFRYSEIYAGVQTRHASLRLHYSPSYFGQGTETIYADLSAAALPAENWRLFAHLGVLAAVGGPGFAGGERYDMSAGLARKINNLELSVSYVRGEPNRLRPNGTRLDRDKVVMGAAYLF
jgi:uncharacterized protein (TIGR02001 family)